MEALAGWNYIDGWIVTAGVLCAVASSLLGNFLVLRRLSMLGDAITHAVLPGLAVAFFISESRASVMMFLGAVVVGVLTAVFTEYIRRVGRVDEGASMGVVFTSMFALGLIMIVQAADTVDLDPNCVLYGAIELVPLDTVNIAGFDVPQAVVNLSIVTAVNITFILVFFKELKISSFDPALATSTGYSSTLMHYLLMVLVAVTAVACFESVGNILVVAMFIVPPATAFLLAERLAPMIWLGVAIAVLSAAGGHVAAIVVPSWFGFRSTSTAGMMATVAGLLFFLAATFSPTQGFVVKFVRRRYLAWKILADDVVALLFRMEERGRQQAATTKTLQEILLTDSWSLGLVLKSLARSNHIDVINGGSECVLTDEGRKRAHGLVRSHRLWEQYLVTRVGVAEEKLHDRAERFEHFTDRDLRDRLDVETDSPREDPHGTSIPEEISDHHVDVNTNRPRP